MTATGTIERLDVAELDEPLRCDGCDSGVAVCRVRYDDCHHAHLFCDRCRRNEVQKHAIAADRGKVLRHGCCDAPIYDTAWGPL